MTQHAYSIANQAGAAFRGDLNNALAAIVSHNSGASAPTTTYAYMLWADTTTGLLKIRDSSNASWITVGELGVANLGIMSLVQSTIQDGSENYLGSVAGTNTLTAAASPTLTAQMATGSLWKLPAAGANTGAATLNVDGQGAVSIVRPDGTALQANDIPAAGYIALLEKRASDVVLLNPANLTATQLTLKAPINEAQGANIASASTINLDTATGNYVHVTGTTAITAIILSQGNERTVVFDGALTLTNGASLILPGGANINTVAGDSAIFRGEAGGIVRCVMYLRSSVLGIGGSAVINSTSGAVIDFTGIPVGVKRLILNYSALSTNGSSQVCVQIGAGSISSTGHDGNGNSCSSGGAFIVTGNGGIAFSIEANSGNSASTSRYGAAVLTHLGGNMWVFNSQHAQQGIWSSGSGTKQLTGVLDRLRLTTMNGVDTFDSGVVSITWEI